MLGLLALAALCLALWLQPRRIIDKYPVIEIETTGIHQALQKYKTTYGKFPAGDSAAIFRALRGENPRQIVFFQCRAGSLSKDGAMLDPWGTPYKVYFSDEEALVRSAGPNKEFDDSRNKHFDDYIR